MNVYTKKKMPIMVISAELSEMSPTENLQRTVELEDWLETKKIPFTRGLGCYKGVKESSFIIACEGHEVQLQRVAFGSFSQETVLLLDENRNAFLVNPINERTPLGKLRGVPKEEALAQDAWTYNYHNEQYYITQGA